MFTRLPVVVATVLFVSAPRVHAQVPGAVQVLPVDLETPRLDKHYGPFCSGDRAYSMVPLGATGKGRRDIGIIHYLDGSKPAVVKELNLPFMKLHDTFNAMFVHQGRPCVVHDSWDAETGVVKLYLQRYATETFEADGPPQLIGEAQFSHRYIEPELKLTVRSSPDGEYLLLHFDHAGNNGFKVALCWVLNAEFEVAWSNRFKLPVFAQGSRTAVTVTDDAQVLLAVVGVTITDELTTHDEEGKEEVKGFSAALSNTSFSAYRMRGEVFETWNGHLPGGRQFLDGSLCANGAGVFFTGLLPVQEGKKALNWAMLRLDDQFHPSGIIAEGATPDLEVGGFRNTQLCAAGDGSMLFVVGGDKLLSNAFAPDGTLRWSTTTSWGWFVPQLVPYGNSIIGGVDLSPQDLDAIKAGKPMKETFDKRPFMLIWDDTGAITYSPLIPFSHPVKKGSYYNTMRPSFHGLGACRAYVDWDNERRPSLYRVPLE
ncbi:MAG: hypothetical protein JNM62_05425 [Flavobacteriales bacterium]|nr:hypothetical protein [Flavobacteriales bacterium]